MYSLAAHWRSIGRSGDSLGVECSALETHWGSSGMLWGLTGGRGVLWELTGGRVVCSGDSLGMLWGLTGSGVDVLEAHWVSSGVLGELTEGRVGCSGGRTGD